MLDSRSTRQRLGMNKLLALRIAMFVLFGVLLLQLAHLQIIKGDNYKTRAANNSVAIVTLPAERGIITDRSGVALVSNVPAYDAVAIPGRIRDAERREIIFQLESLLSVPAERLDRLISEGEEEALFSPVILKENLTREEALLLRELEPEMRGISLEVAATREYETGQGLAGQLLAPIVGYIGPINAEEYGSEEFEEYGLGDRLGRAGVEFQYESYLRGEDGRKLIEQDALGRQLRLVDEQDPVPGDRVVLALDYSLQNQTALALDQAMKDFDAPIGAAVAVDVHTGEVLALVSLPSYDANLFAEGVTESQFDVLEQDTEGRPLVNHAISDAFPPGSVFKVVTAAAALEYDGPEAATPETRLYSPGFLNVNREDQAEGEPQRFNDTATGTFDFVQGLAISSNVYFYCLVAAGQPGSQFFDPGCGPDPIEGVGPGNVARMADRFGLGKTTGIDLPSEVPGFIPPTDQDGDPNNVDDDVGDTVPDSDASWEQPDKGLTNLSAWFARLFYQNTIQNGDATTGVPGEPWRMGSTLQFAIGQNVVTTSPVQMAMVTAAIANGGALLEPRMVHDIIGPDGQSREGVQEDSGRFVPFGEPIIRSQLGLAPETLVTIREGMRLAVAAEYGTARGAGIAGVQVAGKTGSPQIDVIDARTGKQRTHAWFVGFGPFENPEIAIAIYVQGGTGGEAAAPVARAMFEAWFNQVNVRVP